MKAKYGKDITELDITELERIAAAAEELLDGRGAQLRELDGEIAKAKRHLAEVEQRRENLTQGLFAERRFKEDLHRQAKALAERAAALEVRLRARAAGMPAPRIDDAGSPWDEPGPTLRKVAR